MVNVHHTHTHTRHDEHCDICSEFDERTQNLRQKIPGDETRLHENQNMQVSKHLHSTNIIHLESNWPLVFFLGGGWAAPFYGSNLPTYSFPIGFYRHLLYVKNNDSRGLTTIHPSVTPPRRWCWVLSNRVIPKAVLWTKAISSWDATKWIFGNMENFSSNN